MRAFDSRLQTEYPLLRWTAIREARVLLILLVNFFVITPAIHWVGSLFSALGAGAALSFLAKMHYLAIAHLDHVVDLDQPSRMILVECEMVKSILKRMPYWPGNSILLNRGEVT